MNVTPALYRVYTFPLEFEPFFQQKEVFLKDFGVLFAELLYCW